MSITIPNKLILGFVVLVTFGISLSLFAERHPVLPAGFVVSEFISLESPRSLYRLPSGDVLVSQSKKSPTDNGENSPNQITRLKINSGKLCPVQSRRADCPARFMESFANGRLQCAIHYF